MICKLCRLIFCVTLLSAASLFGQVGIGTTEPAAELEIQGTNTGIPTLMLNPQTAPVGTGTGQLAVVGDLLYMYDATRAKWLSVESTSLQWGKAGNSKNEILLFGGNVVHLDSGTRMPFNGTIVYTTVSTRETNTFGMAIWVRNGITTISTFPFNLVGGNYTNTNVNLDFNAGDYIQFFAANDGDKKETIAIAWVKWRL